MQLKQIPLIACFVTTCLPTVGFAFFCPTNFNQIELGNTNDQVIQACGKPDKVTERKDPPKVPQEWTYFIPQTVATASNTAAQGTLKTSVTFDASGKAINISVNGIGVGNSTICGGNMIQLGDTLDSIKTNCGTPSFINKQEIDVATGRAPPENTVTEFTYNTNPPITLVFTNGQLTERK